MTSAEIRTKFLKFFEEKGHKVVSSSSLVPENDSSVLFITAGMQQFKPYYTGAKDAQKDFNSLNTVSVQKCVRTSDIDEVGDESHLTFFEMLGNFSFGGYGRKEAIIYAHDFITKELGLEISYVSFYEGSENVPKDEESKKAWEELGVENIKESGDDVFWGPTGNSGPCGPTTEIYCKNSEGKDVEIWNIVFNEYFCDGSRDDLNNGKAKLTKLPILGIDTGMGLERLVMIMQKVSTVFETDLFAHILKEIKSQINTPHPAFGTPLLDLGEGKGERSLRIIADHIRTATFMIADGVIPSNTDRGYILRRIIRRAVIQGDKTGFMNQEYGYLATQGVVNLYEDFYPELKPKRALIHDLIYKEEEKFRETLSVGIKEIKRLEGTHGYITGAQASSVFSSYGVPLEIAREITKIENEKDFYKDQETHRKISAIGAEKKFKGGLAGHSEMEIKYHTATHLLRQALEDVLKTEITQKGSNITSERLRFDFSFSRKMTDEEKENVEDIVNKKIDEKLSVNKIVMKKEEAEKTGAAHIFGDKYGDEVSIYSIGDSLETAYSKEFCGGPHVGNTSELGSFKILKEEAVSAGVRRIKAVLE